jgi:CBS domain-containing protein
MAKADLAWPVERLSVAYFPQDTTLPNRRQAPDYLSSSSRVVEGEAPGRKPFALQLITEEPLALLTERAVANRYIAASDAFCYHLAAADFHTLLGRSRAFNDTRAASPACGGIAAAAVRICAGAGGRRSLLASGSQLIRHTPHRSSPAPLGCALAAMDRARVGSVVICNDAATPVGILTLKDVLKRVTLAGIPLTTPIASVMTADPATLEGAAPVSDALLLMARQGIHHMPLVEAGRLIGVVSEKDGLRCAASP